MRPPSNGDSKGYQAWLKAVSKPARIAPAQPIAHPGGPNHGPASSNNSTLFAGDALVPNSGVQYIGIAAYFYLPDTFTPGVASFWTGLDGYGPDLDIIQAGVDATYNRQYSPWFQYLPNSSLTMVEPAVHFQDEVLVEAWSSNSGYCDEFSTKGEFGCGQVENVTTNVVSGYYFQPTMNHQFQGKSGDFFVEKLCADSQCSNYSPLTNFQQIWMEGEALDTTDVWHDYATDPYVDVTMLSETLKPLAVGMDSNGTNVNVVTWIKAQ